MIGWCFSISQSQPSFLLNAFWWKPINISVSNAGPRLLISFFDWYLRGCVSIMDFRKEMDVVWLNFHGKLVAKVPVENTLASVPVMHETNHHLDPVTDASLGLDKLRANYMLVHNLGIHNLAVSYFTDFAFKQANEIYLSCHKVVMQSLLQQFKLL